MALKARFIPKNPQKYMGNVGNIMARSSWEVAVMKFFDSSTSVVKWGSEEIAIPYLKPTDGQVHKYYPDFIVVYQDKDGNMQKELIEVKPLKESLAEKATSQYDKVALAINVAKWKAADMFAKAHGMRFRVLTEATLFKQTPKKPKMAKTTNKPTGTKGTKI
jgi:hypothetical protein